MDAQADSRVPANLPRIKVNDYNNNNWHNIQRSELKVVTMNTHTGCATATSVAGIDNP